MKAAVYYGKNNIKTEDVPIPEINEDEYLLKVTYCGLCKTDIKKIRGITLKTKGVLDGRRVFGHEIVGKVEKIGSNINYLQKGDRVAIFHHVPCLECYYCLNQDYTKCETYRTTDTSSGIPVTSGATLTLSTTKSTCLEVSNSPSEAETVIRYSPASP